jgi:CDP-glucose 4,6-dehydratase
MFKGFYSGRKVVVTGHTGFKGSWMSLWLKHLGAEVHGISLPAPTEPNLHEIFRSKVFTSETVCDIRNLKEVEAAVHKVRADMVFHMAAQPIVRLSYSEPLQTLETNVNGTAHVLEAVRRAELGCPVIVVTSDKCYENREWEFAYRENDALGGHDVYSMSKGAAELVAQSWNKSFFVPNPKLGPVVTVRAGNVIGGGDYALDRIVPDCVRALSEGKSIEVRNPRAIRPWQHVLECLSGYLWLGARVAEEGKNSRLATPFNFGPEPSARQPVRRLVEEILTVWKGEWIDASKPGSVHEATLLSLSIEKAGALLGWYPAWDFAQAVHRTTAWYQERHLKKNSEMLEFSLSQIDAYIDAARAKKLAWAA